MNLDLKAALNVDDVTNSRPLRIEESQLENPESLFDTISYSKAIHDIIY